MPLTGYGAKDGQASPILRAPRFSDAPQAAPQTSPAAEAPSASGGGSLHSAENPPPSDPRSIRLKGRTLVVSDESFERIKLDKNLRAGLKANF
jgi:hypothetical protein